MADDFAADSRNDLAGYFHAFVETEDAARSLRNRLANERGVTYVAVQGRPRPALMIDRTRSRRHAGTSRRIAAAALAPLPDYQEFQGYLAAAPTGIDALYAWTRSGGTGAGVRIIDIESSWDLEHEDLRQHAIGVTYGVNLDDDDHGTAVLGIFAGDPNGFGITGIASGADVGVASWSSDQQHQKWNVADAIRAATDRLRPGDVILLEMHAPGPHSPADTSASQKGYIPIEFWQTEFAAIRRAVARGIHVVEAGGNGGEDLDHPVYHGLFSRGVRDSGAILVGGGVSALRPDARSRMWWSNYGSRLDAQGWGEDIVTTGGRSADHYRDLLDDPDRARCYTHSFGGTSGASPIVVGAVACLAGVLAAAGRAPLTPAEMRRVLVETGTPQQDGPAGPISEHIGPLPNLRRCIDLLLP